MNGTITPLMFSVTIEQLDKKLKDWTDKINAFVNNGGKGYKLKIDFGDAEGVIKALKNLKVGDNSEVERLQKELDGVRKKLDELNKSASSKGLSENLSKSLGGGASASKKAADDIEKSKKRVVDAYSDMMKSLNALQMDRAHGRGLGIDISNSSQIVKDIKAFAAELSRLSSNTKFLGNADSLNSMMSQYERYMQVIRMLRTEINNLSKAQREQSREADKQKIIDKRSVNEAIYQIAQLEKRIASMRMLQKSANELGIKTPNLDKLLKDMDAYMQKFVAIFKNGGRLPDGTTAQMVKAEGGYRALTARMQENTQETRVNIAARNAAVAAVGHLAGEEMRLAQYINQSTSALHGQSQVLQDLKSMAAQYISAWGAMSFIDNIIEKGGQLEQQRLSIGAILGDTAQATDLFEKVKTLAVKSPFGVTELDAMTKQLSTYGFEYSELFELTKRMADISAATGTEVSRLALALGHVKSETALTGYTLRQFSMANVPLLQKLADKLGVTTSQIRKMVSKKEISYEDVLGVIKDLTDQGGPFFEAQETMSEALNAKFKNLRDSYEIMFNEIAESGVGGALKDVAGILTKVSRHWEELFTIVGTGIVTFGGMRAYLALTNSLLGANARAVMGGIRAYQQAEAMNMRLARSYRDITLAENAMVAATNRWTLSERMAHTWIGRRIGLSRQLNDAQKYRIATTRQQIIFGNALALSEGRQTTEDLARSVALGKVSKAQARQAIQLSDLSEGYKRAGIAAVNSVRTYGRMTGVINGVTMSFTKLGMALKSMFLNPQMAVFALLAGVMELWQRNKQEVQRAKELNDELFNRAQEGIKNIRTMMDETGMTYKVGDTAVEFGDVKDILNGKFTYPSSKELDTSQMMAAIDKWTSFIKEYSATPNLILNDAFKDEKGNVRETAEQYEILAKSVGMVADAYVYLKQVSGAVEFAENATNVGVFNDDFVTNINDYSDAVKKYNDSITSLTVNHAQSVQTALEAARGEKTFAAAIKSADAVMMKNEKRHLTEADQLKMLVENQDKYTEAIKAFEDAAEDLPNWEQKALTPLFHGGMNGSFFNFIGNDGPDKYNEKMKQAFSEMDADATTWANNLKAKLTELGWDFDHLNESQKQSLALAITETVSKASNATDDIRKEVKKLANEKFGIQLDVKTIEAATRIDNLKRSLEGLVGHDWHIDIKTASNFSDVITKIRQEYKSAQDYFNNLKPLMINMGVNVAGGMKPLTPQQRQSIISRYMAANPTATQDVIVMALDQWDAMAAAMKDAMDFSKATGIHLTDPNPGGSVLREKHPKQKSTSDKHTADKELEQWRKRVQLLEKYMKELADLEKLMSRSEAESKLKADGNFAPLWGYFSNPNDFNGSLDFVASKLGTKSAERKSFVDELGAKKSEEELRIFKEDVSDAVKELDRMADVMRENYDVYKKWLDLTGDESLAAKIAGVAQNSTLSGWLIEKMNGELKKHGDNRSAADIFNLSESEVSQFGRNSAIFKIWEEWQKNEDKIKKQNLELYANAIKNAKGYAEKVADINRELEKEIAAIKEMTGGDNPTPEQQSQRDNLVNNATKNAQKKVADLTWQNFKETEDWGRVFGDLDKLSTGTLKRLLANLKKIAPTLNGSVESTKAVYEAIEKLETVLNGRNPFKAMSESFNRRKALGEYYKQAKQQGSLVADAELSSLLGVELGSTVTKDQIKDGMRKESEEFQRAVGKVVDGLQAFQGGLNLINNLLEATGNKSGTINDFSTAVGGTLSGASSMSALGDYGMIAGAVVGLFTSFATIYNKHVERKLEEINSGIEEIDDTLNTIKDLREQELGYDYGNARRELARQYEQWKNLGEESGEHFAKKFLEYRMYQYYSQGTDEANGYAAELALLKKQRDELKEAWEIESDRKHPSDDALEEYVQKMAEVEIQIKNFTQDLAKELWDIDVKGWADQLSDALASAFENGESMAKAYGDTVRSILQSVMQKMMQIKILEPMFESLQDKLFGENGVFNTDDINGSMSAVTKAIGEFFGTGGEGERSITAATEFMTAFQHGLQSVGLSVLNESGSTLSSDVQGMREETADLLAGYINTLRQDVAVIRLMKEAQYSEFIQNYWAGYIEQITGMGGHVAGIHDDTKALVRMIESGDGALYETIKTMSNHIENVTSGIETFAMR